MPNFIDLFGAHIENKKEKIVQYLTKGVELKFLREDYKRHFNKNFFPFNDNLLNENYETIAIDASGNKSEFANGVFFYINRAYGVINNGENIRELDTDVFSISGSATIAETYVGWKAEDLEFKVLSSYLKDLEYSTDKLKVCLIDGSLYARANHFIIESTVLDDEDYILKYLDSYIQILNEAKQKNVLLIGLSKDSRSTFFRNGILDEIFYEERDIIKDVVSESELKLINIVIKGIDELNENSLKEFRNLLIDKPTILEKIRHLFYEYKLTRTDGEILYRFAKSGGFTRPMEMGLGRPQQKNKFNQMKRDPVSFLRSRFRNKIDSISEEEKEKFYEFALKVMAKLLLIPTFISFHILPDIRDIPIKVDIPSWYFERNNVLSKYHFVDFIDYIEPLMEKMICFIMKLYGGINNYNLLLSAAHKGAVLSKKTYFEIYEQFLKDKLDILLPYKRRTRRDFKK